MPEPAAAREFQAQPASSSLGLLSDVPARNSCSTCCSLTCDSRPATTRLTRQPDIPSDSAPSTSTRWRCYDVKNIFAEKIGEKIGVFDTTKRSYEKIEKRQNFRRKLAKNVIITSTPGGEA
jgi:hypothetical protein